MNKPLLLSLAAATLLGTNLNAETMYERIQAMELEMSKMQKEITTLKAQKTDAQNDDEKEESEKISSDEEPEEDEEVKGTKSDEEGDDEEEDEEMDVEEEIRDIQETLGDLNRATSGNKLKFGVDYRFAIENLNYEMANGDEAKNDAFMTNRFWMNMSWSATKNLSFKGQLAYNKAFGQRTDDDDAGYNFENFDWIANENAYDDIIRLRSAYFLYVNDTFMGADIPWTFSIGRRPSTNGHLINLRDDDYAASPMGHSINVEFDGLSSKFSLDNLTGVEGMYVKFCAGRGMSSAAHKFTSTPYASEDDINPNIDLIGLIFTPYNNGHYALNTQYYYANNLIDQVFDPGTGAPTQSFKTVGGLHSFTANVTVNGIGNEWSDFLDDSIFFISGAMSMSDPKDGEVMFNPMEPGESQTGYSGWIGMQIPSLISEDGRWGFEYNYGTEYWRSITYGEDTNIGSKIATRGSAYEAYFTEYLVDEILSMQIRYTYIDYDYSGSNGFFGGSTGASMEIADVMMTPGGDIAGQVVDKAQDIRFYLRYKY